MSEPKILIAIMCCHSRRDFAEASRQTWIKDIQGADYKIFYGYGPSGSRRNENVQLVNERELKPDEVLLDVPDNYLDICAKIHEIIRWAFEQGYDHLFKVDDDTYVRPDRLLASDFKDYDFVGGESFGIDEHSRLFRYQGGVNPSGPGFWLSRKAMQIAVSFPRPGHAYPDEPWLGWVMRSNGTNVHMDARLGCYGNLPMNGETFEFVHCNLPKEETIIAEWEFSPEKMLAVHEQWKTGTRRLPQRRE